MFYGGILTAIVGAVMIVFGRVIARKKRPTYSNVGQVPAGNNNQK